MTMQQVLGRCMPAIISQDKQRIMDAFTAASREYLADAGKTPFDVSTLTLSENIEKIDVKKRLIVAAIVEALIAE